MEQDIGLCSAHGESHILCLGLGSKDITKDLTFNKCVLQTE